MSLVLDGRRLMGWTMLTIGVCGIVVLLALGDEREAVTEFGIGVVFGAFWWFVEHRWVSSTTGPVTQRLIVRLALFVAIPLVGLGAPPVGIALGFGFAWLAPH